MVKGKIKSKVPDLVDALNIDRSQKETRLADNLVSFFDVAERVSIACFLVMGYKFKTQNILPI